MLNKVIVCRMISRRRGSLAMDVCPHCGQHGYQKRIKARIERRTPEIREDAVSTRCRICNGFYVLHYATGFFDNRRYEQTVITSITTR